MTETTNDAMRASAFLREVNRLMPLVVVKLWTRYRIRLGFWLVGDGYKGATMRLWLIRERALNAITQDGGVILANCEPLAAALYEPIPGRWLFSITHIDDASSQRAVPTPAVRGDREGDTDNG